jgi:hypothetical protein
MSLECFCRLGFIIQNAPKKKKKKKRKGAEAADSTATGGYARDLTPVPPSALASLGSFPASFLFFLFFQRLPGSQTGHIAPVYTMSKRRVAYYYDRASHVSWNKSVTYGFFFS